MNPYKLALMIGALFAPASISAQASLIRIPAMTVIDLRILDHLNSKTSHVGDRFMIEVAQPVSIDGAIAIPAGAKGMGEVIHAARARAAGKAGELILAARYVDVQGTQIPLRSFQFGRSGKNYRDEAFAVGVIAGPLAYFIVGGEVEVPVGTLVNAKVAADASLSAATANQF